MSQPRLALSATLHCLLGCGLGEVAGIVIGRAFSLPNMSTMILGIMLGFVFGFALGILPLLRAGLGWAHSLRQVLVAEGLSILVMETAEVLVETLVPGVMNAGLANRMFWVGMALALAAGFAAAYPVNYVLAGKGLRHHH